MNIIKSSRQENLVCEQQAKFVQERVSSVETNVAELCSAFSLFSSKSARLRDANDEVAKALMFYSEAETINKSLKVALSELAKILNNIGDFRDLKVQRLDKKVVEVMAQYGGVCGRARTELKSILGARERELNHQRNLDRLTQHTPHNRHQIAKAEAELIKAKSEVSRNQKALEEQIDVFEKRKLKDMKKSLLDYVKIELALHAKALELFTQAYNAVSDIDEEQDLEELKSAVANDAARLNTVKKTSFRSSSLQSIANLFSTPQRQQTSTPALPKASLHNETQATAEEDSRIVSLRDEDEEDLALSPFAAIRQSRQS